MKPKINAKHIITTTGIIVVIILTVIGLKNHFLKHHKNYTISDSTTSALINIFKQIQDDQIEIDFGGATRSNVEGRCKFRGQVMDVGAFGIHIVYGPDKIFYSFSDNSEAHCFESLQLSHSLSESHLLQQEFIKTMKHLESSDPAEYMFIKKYINQHETVLVEQDAAPNH